MAQKRFSARIYGRVQGVGFRFFAREVADELGVVGYVRNIADGGVEVVAEGDETLLEEFVDLLKAGPRSAYVSRVELSWGPPTGAYDRFHVKL
ncbi:MAG TPA: acylphosphatase [Armatimonadota bacterium]|nr:acylphosphatase [Armatimonadota bacterium]